MPLLPLLAATIVAALPGAGSGPGAASHSPARVLSLRWGAEQGAVGRTTPDQGNFEGPKAFTVDAHGRVAILDQLNRRVQLFQAGRFERAIDLAGTTYDDVEWDVDGGFALLDRIVGDAITLVDPTGRAWSRTQVHGSNLPEGGYVTALFRRPDGFWVEAGSRFLVRLADAQGHADPARKLAAGRFTTTPGRAVRVRLAGRNQIELLEGSVDGKRKLAPVTRLSFPLDVHQVEGVETLPDGRLVIAAHLWEESAVHPYPILREFMRVLVLDPTTGRELAHADLPAPSAPEQAFRRLRVGGDGAVYYLENHGEGITLWRWTP